MKTFETLVTVINNANVINESAKRNENCLAIYDYLVKNEGADVNDKAHTKVMQQVANEVLGIPKTDHNATVWRALKVFQNGGVPPTPKPKTQTPKESKPKTQTPKESKPKTQSNGRVQCKEFNRILQYVKVGIPVYLAGPAGTGKSDTCEQVAKELGLDFYSNMSVFNKFDIEGFVDANGEYHETEFFRAFTKGGVYNLDEVDASMPETLVVMNTAIAQRYYTFPGHERIHAHKDFRVVVCGNTVGKGADDEYTGRSPLDAATLNRFAQVFVNYDRNVEVAIAKGDTEIVDFIDRVREVCKENDIKHVISYRQLIYLRKMVDENVNLAEAIQDIIFAGMEIDDIQTIARNLRLGNNKFAKVALTLAA